MKLKSVLVIICLLTGVTATAKLYKWVDENGEVHYSDRLPPEKNKLAYKTFNNEGVVIKKVKRELTSEEKRQKAEEIQRAKELAEQQRLKAEAEQRERTKLLKTYTSEEQIIRLKAERVESLRRNIETAKKTLLIQQKNHQDLMKRAANKERSGEVVSKTFLTQIKQIKEQISFQKHFIKDKTAEIAETQKKYDEELAKYRQYTGKNSTPEKAEKTKP